jgi:CheY-like chemotaxis protein
LHSGARPRVRAIEVTNSALMLQMGSREDANTVRQGVLMLRIDPDIFQVADEFLSNKIAVRKRKARSKRLTADKPTILVVDDEKIIADTTAEILNRFGFRAVRTYDAQTALQIAAKLKPDFLLTDVSMPTMNWVELAIAITKLLPATKILLFSGQAGISDNLRERGEEGYAFDIVAKPIHPEKLMEHLKERMNATTQP